MTDSEYYVVECIAESHETDRTDLSNEEVLTVPVVDGPYDTPGEAKDNGFPEYGSNEEYAVVGFHPDRNDD